MLTLTQQQLWTFVQSQPSIDQLQVLSSVTEDEKRTIEQEQSRQLSGARIYPHSDRQISIAYGSDREMYKREPKADAYATVPRIPVSVLVRTWGF